MWGGRGADPVKLERMKDITTDVTDFDGFLNKIRHDFDEPRVTKALQMLKKDRFQLFSEETDDGVLGVIKSQRDSELVYACKLGSEGTFSCCTQNLYPCGGLRGALCKHILCLIIGLTKAGQLDPGETTRRVIASKSSTPCIHDELITDLFMKYASASVGEIDWRPTETIPEDYFSF